MYKNDKYKKIQNRIVERISNFDNPYRSLDRYALITDDDEPGEFIELDKLLRNTRIMPLYARKRNLELVESFDKFSREQSNIERSKWRFWNIRPKSGKADAANLRSALAKFNSDINRHFTAMRARMSEGFEVLLLCIHLDYSYIYKKFDLHAHFICKIDPIFYDEIYKKIHIEFSEEHTPDEVIRNPSASANYAISGTIKHELMIEWPDDEFKAICDLFISKKSDENAPRLIRPCGSFKAWRREERERRAIDPERAERARRAANRKETADPRRLVRLGDQVIKRVERFWVPADGRYRSGVLVHLRSRPTSGVAKPDTPIIIAFKSPANITAIQTASFGVVGALPHHAIGRPWWWRTWPYGRTCRKLPRPIRRRLARVKEAGGARKVLIHDDGELTSRSHYGRYMGHGARTQVPAVSPP